jgi:hypothetical protein
MLLIVSPSLSGISRNAPLNDPSKRNVIVSSTSSEPSGSTWISTFASGRTNDFASAVAGDASRKRRATARSR